MENKDIILAGAKGMLRDLTATSKRKKHSITQGVFKQISKELKTIEFEETNAQEVHTNISALICSIAIDTFNEEIYNALIYKWAKEPYSDFSIRVSDFNMNKDLFNKYLKLINTLQKDNKKNVAIATGCIISYYGNASELAIDKYNNLFLELYTK